MKPSVTDQPDAAATPTRPNALRTLPGEADVPWAMQLAMRIEKVDAPTDLEACEAAARACVELIDRAEQGRHGSAPADAQDAAAPDIPADWFDAVEAWRGVAIRKVVRRCRGKRWLDAQELAGVTVRQGKAEVRAFVPAPVRPLPPQLAKMQVEGTDLEAAPSTAVDALVTVRISPLIDMTTGKTAAQCAHAAQRAWERMDEPSQRAWRADGYRVRVVRDTAENWAAHPGQVSIVDAGFTELDGQHETTRADWVSPA